MESKNDCHMEFNGLKKFMQLKNSYSYELDLLCRYSHQNFSFRFLSFKDEYFWGKLIEKFAIIFLRIIINWTRYSRYYVTGLIILFLLVVAFAKYPFIYLGAIAFAILLIYIPVLMINEEIKRYEILNVVFESREGKAIDEKCFKNISPYDDVPKMKFLIKILKGANNMEEMESQEYKEKLGSVLGYASDSFPNYDVIKAFVRQGENVLLIK